MIPDSVVLSSLMSFIGMHPASNCGRWAVAAGSHKIQKCRINTWEVLWISYTIAHLARWVGGGRFLTPQAHKKDGRV